MVFNSPVDPLRSLPRLNATRTALDKTPARVIPDAMHLADFPQLKAATPEQKLELIDELWASIPADAVATPQSHLAELDRRLSALTHDPKKALSPEDARIRIRERTGL